MIEITYEEWKQQYKPRVVKEAGEGKLYVNLDGTPAYSWFDCNKEDYEIMKDVYSEWLEDNGFPADDERIFT